MVLYGPGVDAAHIIIRPRRLYPRSHPVYLGFIGRVRVVSSDEPVEVPPPPPLRSIIVSCLGRQQ